MRSSAGTGEGFAIPAPREIVSAIVRLVRGPLLSGPLGSSATVEALARRIAGHAPVLVIGPGWLGTTLATAAPVVALFEPEQRSAARKAARHAARAGLRYQAAVAGPELPLPVGLLSCVVVESAAGLDQAVSLVWIANLARKLRPGGILVALDVTDDGAVEAHVAGAFLAALLTDIAQERPRQEVLLTTGVAPPAAVTAALFADP